MSAVTFPTPTDLARGARASFLLLRMNLGMSRSLKPRFILFLLTVLVVFTISVMTQIGEFVKFVAMEQDGAAQIYALTYLGSFQQGQLGVIGAAVLGASVVSSLLSPFTGGTSTSFIPPKDVVGLSVTRWQRVTDSVIAQFTSSISMLQLVALSALTSMLTIEGGRVSGLLLTWCVWFALVCLTNLSLWVSEYVHRRFGKQLRWGIGIGMIVGVAFIVYMYPEGIPTAFGLGTLYSDSVMGIASYDPVAQLAIMFSVVIFGCALLYSAAIFASVALSYPEVSSDKNSNKVYRGRFAITANNEVGIFLRSIVRSPEVRKPIISAVVIGTGLLIFAPPTLSVNTTFAIIIPLIVALSWGSNAFAHLGGGASWIFSQPNMLKNAPRTIMGLQIAMSLVLFLVIWVPSLLMGKNTLDAFLVNLMAVGAASIVVARSATTKTFKRPSALHFGARSEASLPPQRALQYTLRMALWGGQYGIVILMVDNFQVRAGLVAAAIAWQFFYHLPKLQKYWEEPGVRAKIANAVNSE